MKHDTTAQEVTDIRAELADLFDAGDKDMLLDTVCSVLGAALSQANQLAARVRELLEKLYGRKGERVSLYQLSLAFAELAGDDIAQEQDADAPAVPTPPSQAEPRLRSREEKAKRRGRKALPPELPREEIRLVPTPEQLAATSGGMSKLGEERSEVLEYEPARFKVLVYVREVWSNNTGEIVTAPVPAKVIDKGLPGPALLTQVVVSKYRDHLPLNRQVGMYRRLGVELSRNTLVDWVAAVAFLLEPLARLIFAQVMVSHALQVDDTHLKVLDRRKAKNIKRGHLWALVGDHQYVAYRYTEDWRGESVAKFLSARVGWMQVDGYKGYEHIFASGHAIEVGCWMHCRRYFVKAFDAGDHRAAVPIQLIRRMYEIERESKQAGDSHQERLERRQRQTKPIVATLKEWIDEHSQGEPPKSNLNKALTYAANQWTALLRPLEDGALELDNGDVERALRGSAMGRRNWLFSGSDEGARRAAIIMTVLESAMRHELDLPRYVHDVLVKISSGWPNSRLEELLPHCWRELHASGPPASRDVQSAIMQT